MTLATRGEGMRGPFWADCRLAVLEGVLRGEK